MNKPVKKIPAFLDSDEVKKLIAGCRKDRHRLGLALMSYAGLRVSEMCTLQVKDLNLARNFIRVNGKGGKERIVPVNARLLAIIEKYLEKHGSRLSPESFLIGKTRVSWHYVIKQHAKKTLGRDDIHCHSLRHSFATSLYTEGVEIEKISQLLGHTKLDTTMIYSHISLGQKEEAVKALDSKGLTLLAGLKRIRIKRHDLTVVNYSDLIGRDTEINELNKHINEKISVILFGPKGVGKSAILKKIENSLFFNEFRKKQTLIKIIISNHVRTDHSPSSDIYSPDEEMLDEIEKQLKKLSIDELSDQIQGIDKIIVIDDVTDLSRTDRKTISKLSEKTVVITATSRQSDKKLFKTYIDIKPLKRYHTRQVLSEMIQLNDPRKKEAIVDDILHASGDNLKEAEYIANQMRLGKSTEEISTGERESNQVSIAPLLLIIVLFFMAWILRSYATGVVAFSYALLIVFRLVFMKYLFMPANRRQKA